MKGFSSHRCLRRWALSRGRAIACYARQQVLRPSYARLARIRFPFSVMPARFAPCPPGIRRPAVNAGPKRPTLTGPWPHGPTNIRSTGLSIPSSFVTISNLRGGLQRPLHQVCQCPNPRSSQCRCTIHGWRKEDSIKPLKLLALWLSRQMARCYRLPWKDIARPGCNRNCHWHKEGEISMALFAAGGRLPGKVLL